MKRAEKREHLIDVAAEIFNRTGYHAAGIDHVIEEAGIAKTTLYRHFGSKDDLIVAVLKKIDAQFREEMRAFVGRGSRSPRQRLLATFDYLADWFRRKTFYGCPFMAAAGEYSEPTSPIFQQTVLHKRLVMAYFEELARVAQLSDAEKVAEQIQLLHEGATAMAHVSRDPAVADHAKAMALALLAKV